MILRKLCSLGLFYFLCCCNMEWWNRKDADNFCTLEVVIVLVVGSNAGQNTAIGLNAFDFAFFCYFNCS
ncbi:hypothetical protein TIFTF001_025067 [Ficus carica]|uniref:Secreted protein n=1 Tax=Ficus carica TaxID=3494 RepID=A0AA88DDV7_FICCA|nr:hypothetical protein TIFTF001_025067 [Ficus carica]